MNFFSKIKLFSQARYDRKLNSFLRKLQNIINKFVIGKKTFNPDMTR